MKWVDLDILLPERNMPFVLKKETVCLNKYFVSSPLFLAFTFSLLSPPPPLTPDLPFHLLLLVMLRHTASNETGPALMFPASSLCDCNPTLELYLIFYLQLPIISIMIIMSETAQFSSSLSPFQPFFPLFFSR